MNANLQIIPKLLKTKEVFAFLPLINPSNIFLIMLLIP